MKTTVISHEEAQQRLAQEAREAEQEELVLVDRLAALPGRYKEAREAAISRYNVARGYLLAGHTDEVPALDLSEAQAVLDSEAELKEAAKEAGLRKLRFWEEFYRNEANRQTALYEALGAPLADLQAQAAKVNNDLKAVEQARYGANARRKAANTQAHQYAQAIRAHEQSDNPIRRMA